MDLCGYTDTWLCSSAEPEATPPFRLYASMKSRRAPTNQHQRTRRDHASETAEDYVEAIADIVERSDRCRVTDLATQFAVSHVTVTKTLARLKKEGLVESEPYGPIHLTATGLKMAKDSKIRHEIVVQFLLAIGVSEQTAATDSEGIEHHVSRETLECMRDFCAKLENTKRNGST